MKLLAILILAAAFGAPAQERPTDPAKDPAFLMVPPGGSMTCTAPSGCIVFNKAGIEAVQENAMQRGAASCKENSDV